MPGRFYADRAQLYSRVRVKHPDWPKRRQDAYVYAVLRKRGWRPEQAGQRHRVPRPARVARKE